MMRSWMTIGLLPICAMAWAQQQDMDRLQGAWRMVSLDLDGHTISGAELGGANLLIQGKHFTSGSMGAAYEGSIELDPATSPKAITLTFTTGPEKGNVNYGIYELEGDKLRICLATRGSNRPKEFKASGAGVALEVFQRGETAAIPLYRAGDFPAGSRGRDPQAAALAALHLENVRFELAPELAGTWAMISGTFDGRPLDPNYMRLGRRVVEGSDMTVMFGDELYSKAKYTVDRSRKPFAIDLYNIAGTSAGKVQHGIYEVNDGVLKLSIAAAGQDRPADFSTSPGDGRTVVTWKTGGPSGR